MKQKGNPTAPQPKLQKPIKILCFTMVFVMGQFLQLGINLACILSPGCAKMAPRLPNILHPSAKMSQDNLHERSQPYKKNSVFLVFYNGLHTVKFYGVS